MSGNDRSKAVTQGIQHSPNRSMLRATGFGDADFDKPIVGIANGYSTVTPCNMGLNELAAHAAEVLRECGAMPQVFGTITVSDAISMGTTGMKYSLVSREVIADSIETVCNAASMDGVIVIWRVRRKKYARRNDRHRPPEYSSDFCLWRHHPPRPFEWKRSHHRQRV